jgi:O-antigen/teichoic acid export membrane protein
MKSRTAAGVGVSIASRVITRAIDFVALILLARLLSPQDFGLVAIALSFMMIVEAIMELPLGFALVALPERFKSHYDSVFTLQLLRGLILTAVLLISAWPLSTIYHDHRLIALVCALSAAPAARGLVNPRLIEYSLNFDFLPNLIIEGVGKLVALGLSVGCAWATRSYWSLAIGTIASPITMLVVSYIYAPYMPAISLAKWRDFSRYVRWTAFGQTIRAFVWQMDSLILGRFVDRSELGGFSMATNLTALPGQILVVQMLNPLVVAFSSIQADTKRLRLAYEKSAVSIVSLGLPIMVGMSLAAEPIVRLAFGEQWLATGTLLRWLALTVIPSFFTAPIAPLAIALDKSPMITRLTVLEFIIRIPVVLFATFEYGLAGVVAARLLTALLMMGCAMVTVRQLVGLSVRLQLLGAWRPILSVAIMSAAVVPCEMALEHLAGSHEAFVSLAIIVSVGAVAYTCSMFLFWTLVGRPDGLESHIVGLLTGWIRNLKRLAQGGKLLS